jgi:hypothetical protein
MVVFTYIFVKLTPSLEAEMAVNYRADLLKKENLTPAEVDSNVANARRYFTTMLTSMAIFGYLVIGGLATAVISGIMLQKKEMNAAK